MAGNVRELENVVEAAVHLTNRETITLEDPPEHLLVGPVRLEEHGSLKEILARAEKQAIELALHKAKGNKWEAAKILGIGKSSLYEKLKKYGL